MPNSRDIAPAAAPSLSDIVAHLTNELGLLRLVRNSLYEVDLAIGHPVTEEACNDVAVAAAQINFVMERLRSLRTNIDILELHTDLRPKVVALAGRRK